MEICKRGTSSQAITSCGFGLAFANTSPVSLTGAATARGASGYRAFHRQDSYFSNKAVLAQTLAHQTRIALPARNSALLSQLRTGQAALRRRIAPANTSAAPNRVTIGKSLAVFGNSFFCSVTGAAGLFAAGTG